MGRSISSLRRVCFECRVRVGRADVGAFLSAAGVLRRLIIFDKRGTGLSDRVSGVPDLETRMDDVRAIMDAEGWNGRPCSAIRRRGDGCTVRSDVSGTDACACPYGTFFDLGLAA